MKTITQIATMAAFILSLLFMCGCSQDELVKKDAPIDYGKLRIGKMDLSGAVSVGLKGEDNSSRAIEGEYLSAGLYKVDASGNISAVGVYFTTDTLGNRLEHEESLRVVPEHLFNLTDNYMLVTRCDYYDSDGDLVSDGYDIDESDNYHYLRREVPYYNLLVRKTDGKIWCVDNIEDRLYKVYTSGKETVFELKGAFKEDSRGNLYFSPDFVYKFNLGESSSSFEQVTTVPMFDEFDDKDNFYVLDNGVVWSYEQYSIVHQRSASLRIAWPHSGYQDFYGHHIIDEIADELRVTLPEVSYIDVGGKNVTFNQIEVANDNYNDSFFFVPYHGKPIAIGTTEPKFRADTDFYWWRADEQILLNCLTEEGWPLAVAYDLVISDTPGNSKLCDNPIKLIGGPLSAINDYTTEIYSYFVGNGYILTYGSCRWISKIDMEKREWVWLKQLDKFDGFNDPLLLEDKIWSLNLSKDNLGAYWFDPVTFEDGFVKFNVELPSFIDLSNYASYPDKCVKNSRNGKLTLSGIDPATGDRTTIVIDIVTGEAVTDTQAPEMLFETLINLN